MSTALEAIAAAADEVADDQRRVARRARAMQRQRDRGRSWAEILHADAELGVLSVLRRSVRRLGAAATDLATVLAGGLAAEGFSRRQIAGRLGVTHQRVSALLRDGRGPRRSDADDEM